MVTGTVAEGWVGRELEELRRPGLRGLLLAALAASWLWILLVGASIQWDVRAQALRALPPAWLCLAAGLALLMPRLPMQRRSALLLVGLGGAFILGYRVQPDPAWLYGQVLVVTAAGLLAGNRLTFAAALLLTLGALLNLRAGPDTGRWLDLLPALGLLWATAITAWLSTRNLYTALGWALASQRRAWQTTDEVRERRGELRRMLDSLHTTYGLLERTTAELEVARAEAEEARRVKSRFVANISHELRTPLNVIVGFAEILCTLPESYGDLTWPAALREDVLAIWRNAEHLLQMVDDVLDLAQIEAARLPVVPEPTDMLQLLRDALQTAQPLVREAGIELRSALPEQLPILSVDRARIRQVLLNLINNAVRFTQQGYVEVSAAIVGREVRVHVRDTGLGIPADKLQAIFQEFEQADTSIRRPHQGAGLGLAISQQFIELHGGYIWAESTPGGGSTFSFSLPIQLGITLPVKPGPAAAGQPPARRERGSVVILSPDPLVVRMLERYLEGLGILPAATLEEAASLVQRQHPEAALVAVETPGQLDAALRQARTLLETVAPLDLPVLACSFPTERRAGVALGVRELLLKPVTRGDVLAAVRRLCEEPRCLLIADDEPDMLRLLGRIVRDEWKQARVLSAGSGGEAIALLAERPDVVLLDLIMPGQGGAEVLQAMRSRSETADTPVLVVTARGPAEQSAPAQNGQVHVLKNGSFSAAELMRTLDALARCLPPHYVPVCQEK